MVELGRGEQTEQVNTQQEWKLQSIEELKFNLETYLIKYADKHLSSSEGKDEMLGSTKFSDFKKYVLTIAEAIFTTRVNLKHDQLTNEDLRMLVYEFAHTAKLHKGHFRKTGEPYFDAHLIPVTKILIEHSHLTSIGTILGALKHDDIEDRGTAIKSLHFPESKYKIHNSHDLLNENIVPRIELAIAAFSTKYLADSKETLDPVIYAQIAEIAERTRLNALEIIDGVTKITGLSPEENKQETFHRLIKASTENLRAIVVKLADRAHNMMTISAHTPENQKRIALETIQYFVPLAELLGLYSLQEILLKESLRVLNPKLVEDFENRIVNERLQFEETQLKTVLEGIHDVSPSCEIKIENDSITRKVKEQGLFERIVRNQNIEMIAIDDLKTDSHNLWQISILTESKEETKKVLGFLQVIESKIAKHNISKELAKERGTIFHTTWENKKITFRVNEVTKESHSVRGIMANTQKVVPDATKAKIREVYGRGKDGGKNWLDIIQDVTERPIAVFTPEGDRIELRQGSTILDFAAKVNDQLVGKVVGANVRADVFSEGREASVVDKVSKGEIIQLETTKEIDLNKINEFSRWVLVAKERKTRVALRRIITSQSEEKQIEIGKNVLEYLANMFGINKNTLFKALFCLSYPGSGTRVKMLQNGKTEKENQIYKKLALGQVSNSDLIEVITLGISQYTNISKKFRNNYQKELEKIFRRQGRFIEITIVAITENFEGSVDDWGKILKQTSPKLDEFEGTNRIVSRAEAEKILNQKIEFKGTSFGLSKRKLRFDTSKSTPIEVAEKILHLNLTGKAVAKFEIAEKEL